MADKTGDSQPNRQGIENRQEEVADDAPEDGDGQKQDFDPRLGDREVPKWVRPAVWAGIPVVLLLFYLFVLPVPIIFLENRDMLSSGGPEFYEFMEAVFRPISWLYENIELYQKYIDWWERIIGG